MKKRVLFFICLLQINMVFSQKSKGFDAQSYFRDYQSNGDLNSLQSAKENIDSAAVHPATKDNPFIQITKGQVYLALYEEAKKVKEKEYSDISDEQKRALAVFENTSTEDLKIASAAFKGAEQLDTKKKFEHELKSMTTIATYFDYSGRARLNAKKYADALVNFEQAYEITDKSDTTLLYFCAVSANYSNNNTKAKEYYNMMIDNKPERPGVYLALANVYFALKDTIGGLEVLKKGRAIHPDNANIVISESNYYIRKNKGGEVLDALNKAIELNSKELNLYLTRGNVYDHLATSIKGWESDSTLEKKREQYLYLAEADYKQGLAIDTANFNLLFNLGVLYFNQGAILNNKAGKKVANFEAYNALNDKAMAYFVNAASLLERAYAIKPTDENTKSVLKQLYFVLKKVEKLKAMEGK